MSQVGKTLGLLGFASVAAVALGLYAYFGVMRAGERETKEKERSAQLFPAAAAEGPSAGSAFKALTVLAAGQTTTLEHDAKGWTLTSPVQAPADTQVVEAIVSTLTHERFKQLVDEHPTKADLARYGLDAPKFQVTATFQKAGGTAQTFTLEGGIENPFDGSVYARRGGEDAVHVVNGALKLALEKSTFQLRDKRLVPFQEAALKRIDLSRKGSALALTRDASDHWRLAAPLQERADDTAVKALWNALQTNQATAFPEDTPQARADFGLEHPTVKATFTPKDGAAVTLVLGETGEGESRHAFARVEDGAAKTTLAQIPPALLDALSPELDALRDHTVLTFEDKDVQRISYLPKAGAAPIELSRPKTKGDALGDWEVTAPKKAVAKGWKVSSLLWALHSLKATAFGPAHPSEREWARHGIDANARAITLWGAGDQVLAKLTVGEAVKGKEGPLWVRGTRDQLLQIDPKGLAQLPKSLEALTEAPKEAASPRAATSP